MIVGAARPRRRGPLAAAALATCVACLQPTPLALPDAAHVLLVGPTDEAFAPIRDLDGVGDVLVTPLDGARAWLLAYDAVDVGVPRLPIASRARVRSPGDASFLPFAAPRELWLLSDEEPQRVADVRELALVPDTRCGERPTPEAQSLERVLVSAMSALHGSARTSSATAAFFTRSGELGVVHGASGSAEITVLPVPGAPRMRPSAIAWDPVTEELLVLRQPEDLARVQFDLLITKPLDRAQRRWAPFRTSSIAPGGCTRLFGNTRLRVRRTSRGDRELVALDSNTGLWRFEVDRCQVLQRPGPLIEDPGGLERLPDGTILSVDALEPRLWVLAPDASALTSVPLSEPVEGLLPTALLAAPGVGVILAWAPGSGESATPVPVRFTYRAFDAGPWSDGRGWRPLPVLEALSSAPPPPVRRVAVLEALPDGFVASGNPPFVTRYVFDRAPDGALALGACPLPRVDAATLTLGAPIGGGRWVFAGGASRMAPANALHLFELPPLRR